MKLSFITFLSTIVGFASASSLVQSSSTVQAPRNLDYDNDEYDISWMVDYSIKYENCAPSSNMAYYRLCPKGKHGCERDCEGGPSYAADLRDFLDAFTEAQLGAKEYACEMARENCAYDDDDLCYENAGLKNCNGKDGDEFDLQEFMGCVQIDDDITGDAYAYNEYWVGPYCAGNAESIFLGLFTDEDCTTRSSESFFDVYGYQLDYLYESILDVDDCVKCKEHKKENEQSYYDQYDDDDVLEQCEELYELANKCESEIDGDVSGCDYIETLLSEEVTPVAQYTNRENSEDWWEGTTPLWIALGITIVLVCAMQLCLLRAIQKSNKRKTGPSEELLP